MSFKPQFTVLTRPPAVPDGTVAVTAGRLLPCLVWNDVEVIEETKRELTLVERFIIKAGLELEQLAPLDIEETISLPKRIVYRLLVRLCVARIFAPIENGRFEVLRENAERAVQERSASERRPGKLSFIFLPRTDDLIAFHAGSAELQRLFRLKGVYKAPVPASAAGMSRASLLRERIQQRRIVNLPGEIVDAANNTSPDDTISALCPAYTCRGEWMESDGRTKMRMWLAGLGKRGQESEQYLELDDAAGLKTLWQGTLDALAAPSGLKAAEGAIAKHFYLPAEHSAELVQRAPSCYAAGLTKPAVAAAFGKGIGLLHHFGLAINGQEWGTEINVGFEPKTKAAAVLFATDRAAALVSRIPTLGRGDIESAIREGAGHYKLNEEHAQLVTPESVLDRLWQLGSFHLVYSLRTLDDFTYE